MRNPLDDLYVDPIVDGVIDEVTIQEMYDEKAFNLLMEIIQLARSSKPYKPLLRQLKIALKRSPKAMAYAQTIVQGIGDKK